MNYNFDEILPRRGTHSIKWDTAQDEETLPMWIADMDFRTFSAIGEALSRLTQTGHFGYNTIPSRFYEAIILWWQERHHCAIPKDWILPSTGVVAGISAAINTLVQPGDEIIIQTPAYNHFFNLIDGCGCKTMTNDLIYSNGTYSIDFDDLELKAASSKAKILLFCSPHNPVGRVWTEQELEKVAAICAKHNVTVIADEIHADLVLGNHKHIPFISIAPRTNLVSVTCSAASKSFNLSGLNAGYLFVKDLDLRQRIDKQLWARASASPSLMACEALIISYTLGKEWLEQLNNYLQENYQFLKEFIEANLSNIKVLPLEGTYLVWLDCKGTDLTSAKLARLLLEKEKLWVNAGSIYGDAGEGFTRFNIACPREILLEGLTRMKNFLEP